MGVECKGGIHPLTHPLTTPTLTLSGCLRPHCKHPCPAVLQEFAPNIAPSVKDAHGQAVIQLSLGGFYGRKGDEVKELCDTTILYDEPRGLSKGRT